ncbi:hypothetical protein QVD17_05684 [Tagetes erecta]|uniref:Uncharacterized protein n=1 Tax=Tagetes erecta TaxID=13708 RepID=A0AAD8PBP2_TARER|nr:hypothetical protein QVD17_05684 [Tagetes erecta]
MTRFHKEKDPNLTDESLVAPSRNRLRIEFSITMALIPTVTAQRNRTMILSALAAETPSGAAPHGFKTRHGREGFHPLIRQALFSFPTDVGCNIPPPLRSPASPLAHRSDP